MIMSIGKVNRACSGAVLGLILCASPGFAQHPANRTPRPAQAPPNLKAQRPKGRELRFAPNRYILFLGDEPLASHFASRDQLHSAAAVSYRQQVESQQQSMIQDLTGRKIQVVGSVSTVMNAIFVVATPDRVAELRGLPGVIGVMPERSVRPNLNKATALSNATAAWAQAAIGGQGNAGNGIKIAILDTGIDAGSVHTNPAFNDAGFTAPSGFPKCNAAVNGTPSDCGLYTNNKVIVARSYVSMIAAGNCVAASLTGACTSAGTASASTSTPDDYSARDRDGHGSAVAAVAAAVQNSGGTVAFSGVAPKAYLGSYKVYGTDGVNGASPESVIIKALDDAIADGMNVINYSSGVTPVAGAKDDVQCGNKAGVPCDPLANAFEVAAQTTVIVTSAGNNSGPYGGEYYSAYNTIESPGTAPSVITVGATTSSHIFGPTVSLNLPGVPANLKNIAANLSDAGFLPWVQSICTFYCAPPFYISGAISGVLVDVTTLGDNGQACSPLPAGSLTDAYALIQRSPASVANCSFDLKAQNATAAGAIGIVFYMADSSALTTPDQICYDNNNGVCDLGGPAVMISLQDGQNLKAYIDAHPGTVVTIDTAGAEQVLPTTSVNTLAIYSSEGPAIDGSIKPDMVATGGFDFNVGGAGLYTVGQSYDPNGGLYTTNGFAAVNGTSFSAPLVAGAAALVLQAHPGWSALKVKSALVNYAAQTVTADDYYDGPVDVQEIGAGLLDANAAVTASLTGVTAVPSTLSFGYLATGTALPKTIPVTVTNDGTASVTLAVAVTTGIPATGATVKADQTSLTLAAGAKTTLNVSLSGTVPVGGEYNGVVTLTSSTPAVTLRMPYMFLVGDGSNPLPNALYDMADWLGPGYTIAYGAVNQDLGPLPIQVLDSWGVPVVGATVTYTVSSNTTPATSGSLILKSVPGSAGSTGNAVPFQPSTCAPSSSSTTLTCTTNNYGIAWVELTAGPTAVGSSFPSQIDALAAGTDITDYVSIVPVPSLTSVQDNGAFGSTIAPGSYVALKGGNLLDANYLANPNCLLVSCGGSSTVGDAVDTTYSSGRLPLTWEYVTVSFDAPASGSLPAISVPGYVEYISAGQINAFVPWELQGYPSVNVKTILAGTVPIPSNVLTVPVNSSTPAFLGYAPGSTPPVYIALAQDYLNCPAAQSYLITPSCPARAGAAVTFYANGLGPTTNQPPTNTPAPSGTTLAQLANTTTPAVVMIGGKQATVGFAGLAPGFIGLYQVNATIPSGLASGNQPITIAIGGATSPATVLLGTPPAPANIVLPIK